MKTNILIALLLVTILALAACGDGASREQTTETEPNQTQTESTNVQEEVNRESIEVVMNDIYYGNSNDNATNPQIWTVTDGA